MKPPRRPVRDERTCGEMRPISLLNNDPYEDPLTQNFRVIPYGHQNSTA